MYLGISRVAKFFAAMVVVLALASCRQLTAFSTSAKSFRDCTQCPLMVSIPAGKFVMGAEGGEEGRPEGPPHPVAIRKAFAAGQFEVTQGQYAQFALVTRRGVTERGCSRWYPAERTIKLDASLDWRNPGYGREPALDEPVVCISWKDASDYVGWLAKRTGKRYRLLSEAEWEYIAHAGASSLYAWGDNPKDACQYGNVYDVTGYDASLLVPIVDCADGYHGVAPVGKFKPNAFGLYDVIGNVWEWTADCVRLPYAADVPLDGTAYQVQGACELRAVRGGSWRTHMFRQRPTWRGKDPENRVSSIFGLRVARDL